MPTELTVKKMQRAVQLGFDRVRNFRNARLLFLRNYVGQYYDKDKGPMGTEPLNLIFNALRILVPNLVMEFPKHSVKSKFMAFREYGELLGMALDYNAKDIELREVLRRWIVDSLFCMGILKTGLCESGQAIHFKDTDAIDPGTIYTEVVDLDDFTLDPATKVLKHVAWYGHSVRIPRYQLLDSGLYQNDLIERLPRAGTDVDDGSEKLSMGNIREHEMDDLYDEVDIVEIWVRDAQAMITVPRADMMFERFLRVADYYGPQKGPLTFLSLTPPVPNNPFPVAPVGIWNDLHMLANSMATKIIEQASRQKDILGYKSSAADDAQEVVDAPDGEAVKMEDPSAVQMFSFGGQQASNEAHLQQLMLWFNLMSGNTEALGGLRENSATATQAQMLQANQAIGLEDMKNIVYAGVAKESAKRAWYLHTDPLIEVPLIRRRQTPARMIMGPDGQPFAQPGQMVEEQIILTPEARRGDFLNFHFDIEPKSMSRLDPHLRLQRAMEFAIKILPAAATAAQICMQLGVPFSFQRFVVLMAKEAGIEWLDEVFHDPDFQIQRMEMMMKTPQFQGSQGQVSQKAPAISPAAIRQNGQPANIPQVQNMTPTVQQNAQTPLSRSGQADLSNRERY